MLLAGQGGESHARLKNSKAHTWRTEFDGTFVPRTCAPEAINCSKTTSAKKKPRKYLWPKQSACLAQYPEAGYGRCRGLMWLGQLHGECSRLELEIYRLLSSSCWCL